MSRLRRKLGVEFAPYAALSGVAGRVTRAAFWSIQRQGAAAQGPAVRRCPIGKLAMTPLHIAATPAAASPIATGTPDPTWVSLIRRRAREAPATPAFRFLNDGETESGVMSVGALDEKARAVGATLQAHTRPGDRVILAHPPGLEFIAAFFGCLYAGVVAVPTFPPRTNGNGHRMTTRARAIVAHAQPAVVLTLAADAECIKTALGLTEAKSAPVIGSDSVAIEAAADWLEPAIVPTTLACLQYTSGTSGTPKGVMLTHAALLANCRQIQERFDITRESRGLVWLPPYHDMGLVGGILTPLFSAYEMVIMPPAAFLQTPRRWLDAVGRYKITHTGGPCFSFGLCVQQISDVDAAGLDLSSLRVTFTGAETVRADVLAKFTKKFTPGRFDPATYLACYGMAETVLMITGVRPGAGLTKSKTDDGVTEHVSCGSIAADAELQIVCPSTRTSLGDGKIGEVWTRGPSVAAGYWQNPEATAAAFGGRLADGSAEGHGPFVRTGDLGFVRGNELFVTGRLKELIIIRGVNHVPHEVERTVEDAHAAIQPQGVAAFSVEGVDGERLALAVELRRAERNTDPQVLIAAVRAAVAEVHGLEAHHVILLKPGGLPRTPSGKVQRVACRDGLADGTLEPAHVSTLAEPTPAEVATEGAPGDPAPALPASASPADLSAWLCAILASALSTTPDQIDPLQPVGAYGLGSADAVGFAGTVSTRLGLDLPATLLWDYPTLAELAAYISDALAGGRQAEAA